jgi:hypothetical protein
MLRDPGKVRARRDTIWRIVFFFPCFPEPEGMIRVACYVIRNVGCLRFLRRVSRLTVHVSQNTFHAPRFYAKAKTHGEGRMWHT